MCVSVTQGNPVGQKVCVIQISLLFHEELSEKKTTMKIFGKAGKGVRDEDVSTVD